MKKLLSVVASLAILSVGAIAAEGKIGVIKQYANGGTSISFVKPDTTLTQDITLVGTVEAQKSMMAIALTAKSMDATVTYSVIQYDTKWGIGQIFY